MYVQRSDRKQIAHKIIIHVLAIQIALVTYAVKHNIVLTPFGFLSFVCLARLNNFISKLTTKMFSHTLLSVV